MSLRLVTKHTFLPLLSEQPIIPADRKWFTRLAVAHIIYKTLEKLDLKYPSVTEEHKQQLLLAKQVLENEE